MKIAIVSEYYYPLIGGISEHIHFFAKECARLGHQVTIITSNYSTNLNSDEFPTFNPGEVQIIRLGKSIPFYSNGSFGRVTLGLGLKRKIREILQSEKFDIVHIHPPTVPTLPVFAQLTSSGPTVGTFHTYFESHFLYRFYQTSAQDAIENLDGRIAVSKLCVGSLTKYIKADFKIIPNGVDIDYFSSPSGQLNKFNDKKINILFLARLDPRNGLEILINAFRTVRKKHKEIRLIVVGDGPLRSYYKLLMDADKDVSFEGIVNRLRPDYYAAADIFCFPVQKASFGITILEAMAAGKPIICSDLEAFHDILGDTGACSYIDPYDEADLANKLSMLIENQQMRITLGENARKLVEKFSWTKITQEVLSFYGKILSGSKTT